MEYNGSLSDCCGSIIVMSDICSSCGEHCEPMDIREELEAVRELTVEQLERIIIWNENGNDTLGEEPYDREDLISTVQAYVEDGCLLDDMCSRSGCWN